MCVARSCETATSHDIWDRRHRRLAASNNNGKKKKKKKNQQQKIKQRSSLNRGTAIFSHTHFLLRPLLVPAKGVADKKCKQSERYSSIFCAGFSSFFFFFFVLCLYFAPHYEVMISIERHTGPLYVSLHPLVEVDDADDADDAP